MWSRMAMALAALFIVDRVAKLASVAHFFSRKGSEPARWPTVTLLQPITAGATGLAETLRARTRLDELAPVQHLLLCDADDHESQALCRMVMAEAPTWRAELIVVPRGAGPIASKIGKLQAGLPHATGEVLWFLDDDVVLRPAALRALIEGLAEPGAGAAFGLACYTFWDDPWSSLMSAFVNGNALLSYVPLCYLTEPFTITGHCFAIPRDLFQAMGGLDGMADRLDDDHELARRVRAAGRRCIQTAMVYEVKNALPSPRAYLVQMKRWFVFPRQMMVPWMTGRDQAISLLGSVGNLLLPLLGMVVLIRREPGVWRAFLAALMVALAGYHWGEVRYLGAQTPPRRWPQVVVALVVGPLQVMWAWLSDDVVEWRGQRLRVSKGGRFEVLP